MKALGDEGNIAVSERRMIQDFFLSMNDTIESATGRLDQAERVARRVVEDRNLPIGKAERETARPENVPGERRKQAEQQLGQSKGAIDETLERLRKKYGK